MKVRMLTNIAGTPSYHTGEVVDLETEIAKVWIKEGLAAPVREESTEKATK